MAPVIRGFRCSDTARVFRRERVRAFPPEIQQRAYRKLVLLASATRIDDLRAPPGNRLEALHGDRAGQHSIRINGQWRVCFVWRDGGAEQVEIVDYHA